MVNLVEVGVYEKSLDNQGRFVVPVALRSTLKEFLMLVYKDHVKLVPKKHVKLTDLFDSVEVPNLPADYKQLKRELMRKYEVE
ncbi:MAG: AbrB family transcriptional regulator [Candidatus Micrarchaeota archaeon]